MLAIIIILVLFMGFIAFRLVQTGCQSDISEEEINQLKKNIMLMIARRIEEHL